MPIDDELTLRPVEPEIADAIYDAVDANRACIGEWLPWCHDGYDRAGAHR